MLETYGKEDKNPFGSYVFYNMLKKSFDSVRVVTEKGELPCGNINSSGIQNSVYIQISSKVAFSESNAECMINYVKKGNDWLIVAEDIDSRLLESLGVEGDSDSFINLPGGMKDTKLSLFYGSKIPLVSYGYFYFPFSAFFSRYPVNNARILGVNEKGKPDFIVLFMGSGKLYLHLAPRAFGNYFLLTKNNSEYLDHVLKYLDGERKIVYWDEYLRKNETHENRDQDFSSLEVIDRYPALRWAFLLSIVVAVLYIVSNFRRRGRPVPEKPALSNDSVDFAETMGRLYYLTRNNKDLAAKMIAYFKDGVRNRFFIRLVPGDPNLGKTLSLKSGRPLEQVTELLNCLKETELAAEISDRQLLVLNSHIEKFYKYK